MATRAKKASQKARKATSKRASRKTAKTTAVRKPSKPPSKAVPASGPVTLKEARALARAKQPKLAVAALQKKAGPPPEAPYRVGIARQELRKQRNEEFDRRIAEYKATMAIMKQRGARRPKGTAPKGGVPKGNAPTRSDDLAPAAKSGGFVPLQILAEGDSWFDYPVPFFGGGIVPRLEDRVGVPILNLAKAGDEVRYMLGVEERLLLTRHLTDGCPAGGAWDVLLFSGGGNDIVDNPMALWIDEWNPSRSPADHIHAKRFATALALVRAGYEDLITLRDRLSPNTHLVFHAYDFAIPDGRGVCFLGPWLKPTFALKKFPSLDAAAAVVEAMLRQFAAMLSDVATAPKVTLLNRQGTLPRTTSSWHNELHPSKKGYDKFADLFHAELERLFPTRVA